MKIDIYFERKEENIQDYLSNLISRFETISKLTQI